MSNRDDDDDWLTPRKLIVGAISTVVSIALVVFGEFMGAAAVAAVGLVIAGAS